MRQLVDWFFRDRSTGRITIGQFPNLPLCLFAAAAAAGWLAGSGRLGEACRALSLGAVVWWAADELLRGVNPWRRCLGAGVLAWLAYQAAT